MNAPPRLRPGDRIGVVAPSGPIARSWVGAGVRVLEREGFRVVTARHLFDRKGHLAGPDAARVADLNRMLRDPDIRCVLMARGGFGAMRIAGEVDWGAMRRDPKIFAGFSDATYLHLGFARLAGVRTLHGPNLHGLSAGRAVEVARWVSWVTNPIPPERYRSLPAPRQLAGPWTRARGRVLGGNLVLLHYAIGTAMMPRLAGAVLFLEEVAEPPYKIDGMLCQLRLSGALRGVKGVALGSFERCVPRAGRRELPLRQVLRDHLGSLEVPVRAGLWAGHGRWNLPLALGARATLDPRRGRLVFEEGLVG
jgi:muramoyltetrapeptide carboxypeptidase